MDLSICILTHSQPELLPKCVEACWRETEGAGIRSEIVLIDNASTDGSPQRVAAMFPGVRIIRNEENMGFGAANNIGIRTSQARYLLILNDDAILCEGTLPAMLRRLESDPTIAAVGPKLLNPDGSLQRGFTNRRFPCVRGVLCGFLGVNPLLERNRWTRDLLTHARDPERGGEAEHLAGACLLARRDALDAVGLFDEHFVYLAEDADLCFRLKKVGWKIFYMPEVHVTHYGSASLNQPAQANGNLRLRPSGKRTMLYRSLLYYFKKNSSRAKYQVLRVGLGIALVLQALLAAAFSLGHLGSARDEWRRSAKSSLRGARSVLLGQL